MDYCGQDAQYPDNSRTFTCFNASGVETPCADLATARPGEVVTDSLTGLMWQRTWNEVQWQETSDYCRLTLNTGHYGGYNDWRLPNRFELQSLADYSGLQSINIEAFPGTPPNSFISSTCFTLCSEVWFPGGGVGYSSSAHYNVRCVRGGAGESVGSYDHYVVSGMGEQVVMDLVTGLLWQKSYQTGRTWSQALAYCEALTYGGFSDWRLPNVLELSGLISNSNVRFPDMPSDLFWSSTNVGDWAWHVKKDSNYGLIVINGDDKAVGNDVRCVRGGP